MAAKLGSEAEISYEMGVQTCKSLPLLGDRHLNNVKMSFFNEPPSRTDRVCVAETTLKSTRFHLVDYEDPDLNFDLFYVTVHADFTPDVSGPWAFGLSCHGTADLYINEELLIDNSTQQTAGSSFWGLGTVEEFGTKKLVAERTYRIRLEFGSAATSKLKIAGGLALGGGGANLGSQPVMDVEEGIRRAEQIARDADVAIICTGISVSMGILR
jgi:beta-glucosidase